MKTDRLFGTDGIRGKFQDWPLTDALIFNISLAVGKWLKKRFKHKKSINVIIGKDTRASCDIIEHRLASGLKQYGIDVKSAGILPTPALAYLTRYLGLELGIMISASHNLAVDNGIKLFKHNSLKLSQREERQIEKITFSLIKNYSKSGKIKKKNIRLKKISPQPYLEHLKECVLGLDLTGMRIVVDCANGAVSNYAQDVFSSLGARVFPLHNKPNGLNINLGCGSLHPEHVARYVKKKRAHIGFSFDGDGDRVILSDNRGNILDGDYIMALISKHFSETGQLSRNVIVATSMSNFGLEKFLNKIKVRLIRADVGDKFVLQQMIKNRANFGGEQSGHIIFLDHAKTGDGMLTALEVLKVVKETGKSVDKLAVGFKKYPQLLINVKVKEKRDFKKIPLLSKIVQKAQKKLKGNGRLVLRYSGTEKLGRIMVEGSSKKSIQAIVESIAVVIQKEIGC